MTTDLVPSISIDNLVNQRQAVKESLLLAQSELAKVHTITHAICDMLGGSPLHRGVGSLVCERDAHVFSLLGDTDCASAMKAFDAEAWRHLLHASGLRSVMDARARAQWDQQIRDCNVPELTKATIQSTFAALHGERGEMFERGVLACFKSLAWDYKTNLPQKFGKRIVVTYINGHHGKTDGLDDLMRVMTMLDGKPEPDHRNGVSTLLRMADLSSTWNPKAGEVSNDYLRIKVYKNGNGHVEFLRPDLVDAMNRIIAKNYPNALAAPVGTQRSGQPAQPAPEFDSTALDFFPTPAGVASMMVAKAGIGPGVRVLEPSAGDGALASAAALAGARVECMEADERRAAGLRAHGFKVKTCDFLAQDARFLDKNERFDAILMNPPFSARRDIHHVTHAFEFLKPGGTLVAVMSAGITFRTDALANEFRGLVSRQGGDWKMLPPDTFKASGTSVNTVLVTLRKEANARY